MYSSYRYILYMCTCEHVHCIMQDFILLKKLVEPIIAKAVRRAPIVNLNEQKIEQHISVGYTPFRRRRFVACRFVASRFVARTLPRPPFCRGDTSSTDYEDDERRRVDKEDG